MQSGSFLSLGLRNKYASFWDLLGTIGNLYVNTRNTFNLMKATRKSSPESILWSHVLDAEYCYLKSVLCEIPSLTLPVSSDNFLLQTDASGVGLGAVLSVIREGEELPVAFWSKKLQPRERNYGATELEGLAVVAAVQHFDAYLIMHPFRIQTDHRALTFLNTAKHGNGRLARWAMALQPYTFSITYRPGGDNANADMLSRLFDEEGDALPVLMGPSVTERRGESRGERDKRDKTKRKRQKIKDGKQRYC